MTRHVAFLVTELYEPVGGLHRYTTNLIDAWNRKLEAGATDLEPLLLAVKDSDQPMKDLTPSDRFAVFMDRHDDIHIYEAERAGRTAYFIDGDVPDVERFHYELWDRFRIPSSKSADWPRYNDTLCTFWYWAPKIIAHLVEDEGLEFAAVDAQDWLAFPGGFLAREELDIPLNCRIHSGEFGRSMGAVDRDAAPVWIEAATLVFADYIQGVSVNDTLFEATHLTPLMDEIVDDLRETRGDEWYAYQQYRKRKINEFLIYEQREELIMLADLIGGIGNGIDLSAWEAMTDDDIDHGRDILEDALPGKDQYIFFLGRPVARKGINELVDAFAQTARRYPNAGLVLATVMDDDQEARFRDRFEDLGIADDVCILSRWLDEEEKDAVLAASDIIALPSIYEPFGIVALEGLAADYAAEKNGRTGPVVVVGGTGGMDEIIQSGVNGFEVPMEDHSIDPGILAQIFDEVLCGTEDREEISPLGPTCHPELRETISKKGAERVQDPRFDWDTIVENVFDIYDMAARNHEVMDAFPDRAALKQP